MMKSVSSTSMLFLGLAAALAPSDACKFQARDDTCYGKDLKERYFYLDSNFTNLNHGSFGAVARPVRQQQREYFFEEEAQPDTWFRKRYYELLGASRAKIARYIKANESDVVLVENASSAVNSVLRSMNFQRGDKVLRLSTAYGMVVHTLDYLVETAGIEVIVANVTFPVTDPIKIVEVVQTALIEYPEVKLCIFSHISSFPAMIEPLSEMVRIIHERSPSSLILIDGAHAPGILPDLDVPFYKVDFYLGNCHKWLYAPKGTAFLWVSPSQQLERFPEPTVISSTGRQDFIGRYGYTGTRDYTGFAALPAALDFRDFLGGDEQIYSYCHNLSVSAGRFLATSWGTDLLVPEEMSGFMVNVILPSRNETAVTAMQQNLNSSYGIYIVVGAVKVNRKWNESNMEVKYFEDTLYVTRLSAQVYLEQDDFRPLAHLVPELLRQGRKELKAALDA